MSTFTGASVTATVARTANTSGGQPAQTWRIFCPVDIQVQSYIGEIGAPGTYNLKVDGVAFGSATTVTTNAFATFTPAAPLVLAAGVHTFELKNAAGSPTWAYHGSAAAVGPVITGTGADFIGWGIFKEYVGNNLSAPGSLVFKVADGTLMSKVEANQFPTALAALAAQTWQVTFNAGVLLTGLLKRLYTVDATGYVLKINGTAVATVAKVSATDGADLTAMSFVPAAPVSLAAGTHTFKIEPSAARQFSFRTGTGTAPSGDAHTTAWGVWSESSANQVDARLFYTLAPVPPGVPTSVAASNVTATTADLSWSAPSTGGSVTGYEVRLNGGTASSATSPHTFTGLTPATAYTLEVRAVGPGGSSSYVSVGVTTVAPPGVPTSVSANPDDDEIVLTWAAPTTGGPATGYDVQLGSGTITNIGNVLTYTFTGLTPATTYTVKVRAHGTAGNSAFVSTTLDTDPPAPPGVPTNVSAAPLPTAAGLTWDAPATGGAVASYEVRINGGAADSTTAESYGFTGLTPLTTYTLEVRAVNAGGASAWVLVSVETTLPDPTPPPTGLPWTIPTAPTYRYLLCDLLTDAPISSLPLTGVSFGRRISRTGSLTGTLSCPTPGLIDVGRLLYAYAGRAALWVYRDNALWWGGIPWTVTPQQGQRGPVQVSVSAATFDSYAHHRRLYADKTYAGVDQGVIIPDLWRTIQGDTLPTGASAPAGAGDIGVVAEDQPTGVLRDRTILATDMAYVGKLIEDLGDVIDGPEHTIDVYLDSDGNRVKQLRVADLLGADGAGNLTDPRFVFSRAAGGMGGNVLEWDRTADAVDGGTLFQTRGTSNGTDPVPFSDPVTRADLLAEGWPLLDVTADHSDVTEQGTLDGHAQALAQEQGGAEHVSGYTVRVGDTGWSPNRLGELVRIKLRDDWHDSDTTVRPVGVDVTPAERGRPETVKLILGDE